MTNVILHGELGRVIGKKWRLNVSSPAEALRAIEANTQKLYSYLCNEGAEVMYRIFIDNSPMDNPEELILQSNRKSIHFMPVLGGSGSQGLWALIAGVLLFAVAVALTLPTGGASVGFWAAMQAPFAAGAGFAGTLALIGVSLAIGGLAQLIMGAPGASRDNERPENKPSYLFNGPVNTYKQGGCVPLGYGEFRCGSQTISAGVRSADIK